MESNTRFLLIFSSLILTLSTIRSQETRLLCQPFMNETNIVFTYGSDIWISDFNGNNVRRITGTQAVERNPVLSPDGKTIAFTSNRSGVNAVYTVPIEGGSPKRLTWHPMGAVVKGWTPDGQNILYASFRDYAPIPSNRLWTVPKDGGVSTMVSKQRGADGSYSPTGDQIVIDVVSRWESEFRNYRGGQNTPLVILNLDDLSETLIPNEKTIDIHPVWLGDKIYFLSDRTSGISNIWSYSTKDSSHDQLTDFKGADIKWLSGNGDQLIFEREGRLHRFDLNDQAITTLNINVIGDFPWAAPKWEDVTKEVQHVSISAKGKRVIMEARGEIFTVPAEHGDTRNITNSEFTADRKPIWSPLGDQIAWFSDEGHSDYVLKRASQDGMKKFPDISLGVSKYAWEPTWSPDGKNIAFVDDDLRVQVVNLLSGTIKTVGSGGINIER